jgi:hypothetical protein
MIFADTSIVGVDISEKMEILDPFHQKGQFWDPIQRGTVTNLDNVAYDCPIFFFCIFKFRSRFIYFTSFIIMSSLASLISSVKANTASNSLVQKSFSLKRKATTR